ncbi:MAG: FkbM family methyltransferase [Tepidisphaeraceae bacterium]
MALLHDLVYGSQLLFKTGEFSLGERLSVLNRIGKRTTLGDLYAKRVRTAPDGRKYFEAHGKKIYFEPDYPVHDQHRLMYGATQVLMETYIFPTFFEGPIIAQPGQIVLDLGANIGTTTMLFSDLVGPHGRVIAFEPIMHETLRRNLKENGALNTFVHAAAVWDKAGSTVFKVSDNTLLSRVDAQQPPEGTTWTEQREVPLVRLDDLCEQQRWPRVDLVKVDIEGAEENALRGALNLIKRFKPKWSISSYHTDFTGEKQHPKLVALLTSLGYTVKQKGTSHIWAW